MITNIYVFFAVMVGLITCVLYAEKKMKLKVFNYLPALTFIYFGGMILASTHLWSLDPTVTNIPSFIGQLKYFLLPMMLFLILMKNDIRDVLKLGPQLLGTFLAAVASIFIGFLLIFLVMKNYLAADAWQTLSVLASSWVGGSTNMAATQMGLGMADGSPALGYAFLMDNLLASFWLVMMISFAPLRHAFNKFSGAKSEKLDIIIDEMSKKAIAQEDDRPYEFMDFMLTIGLGVVGAGLAVWLGKTVINPGGLTEANALFGVRGFFSGSGWVIITATLMGIIASMTPARKIKGPDHFAGVLIYIIVGLIASSTDFSSMNMGTAAVYIAAGFLILLFHLIILLILAKIFKLDLYICGIASQACIGGSVSAPILAATYDKRLASAGLIMGVLGSAIGTVLALLLAKIMQVM